MSPTTEASNRANSPRKVGGVGAINAILASCETLLSEGRKPSKSMHDDITNCLRGGAADPAWEYFPLTRTWFSQIGGTRR